jgi:oligopeptide transport system substrate-binding protein
MARRALLPLLSAALVLSGCARSGDGALAIAFVDSPEGLFASNLELSSGAQHVRAATRAGLVVFNAQGEVIPGLADRWIVTDDGLSFIFRLREGTWPDGRDLTAESVRAAMADVLRQLDGTALGLDLAPIEEVRAMAGRVVEIRLASPMGTLLQLLAQPELALKRGAGDTGDMLLMEQGRSAILTMKRPSDRGLPEEEEWRNNVRPLHLHAATARAAIRRFYEGRLDLVLGNRIGAWPLADTGPLSRGNVQIDPALGLFGLQVRRPNGVLGDTVGREAIAMAIDRPALIAPFNIGGWSPTSRVVAPGLPGDRGFIQERWADLTIEQRREVAARRVAGWRAANEGSEARLSVALSDSPGESPGLDLLYRQLAAQLASIGVVLERVSEESEADLVLVDIVARYAAPAWFLNQFHCSLRRGLCNEDVDLLVEQIARVADTNVRATLLAEAEAQLTVSNIYIPFGQPLRWSLVRSRIDGFAANQWAFHPLPPLAQLTR